MEEALAQPALIDFYIMKYSRGHAWLISNYNVNLDYKTASFYM